MASTERITVIVPWKLGAASKYPKHIFPLEYHDAGDPLSKGGVLLTATLEEMKNIADMGFDLIAEETAHFNTRAEYETLAAKETRLQNLPKSYNPFTLFRYYRAARMFHDATRSLFLDTKYTSMEKEARHNMLQAVPSGELHAVNDNVPPDTTVDGFAILLPGQLDQNTQNTILAARNAMTNSASAGSVPDPFTDDPYIPQLADDESAMSLADTASLLTQDAHDHQPQQTEPTSSPGSQPLIFNIFNSVLAAGSNLQGTTFNHGMGGSTIMGQPPP